MSSTKPFQAPLSSAHVTKLQTEDLKALLIRNRTTLDHFSLIPTRTLTWSGTLIAYKVYPLLSDVEGCLTIRLGMKETQDMVDVARKDPDLTVTETQCPMFMHDPVPLYHINLVGNTPLATPCGSPTLALHQIPSRPLEKRFEWQPDEETVVDEKSSEYVARSDVAVEDVEQVVA